MGWFSKKEEKSIQQTVLPELPDLPGQPMLKEMQGDFNQNDYDENLNVEVNPVPELPTPTMRVNEANTHEIREMFKKPELQKSRFPPLQSSYPDINPPDIEQRIYQKNYGSGTKFSKQTREGIKKTGEVYVRLDKFETTIEAFDEIKNKVIEIERILAKTRDIKAQEEKELEEWENELQLIKSRLESIDKTIFDVND